MAAIFFRAKCVKIAAITQSRKRCQHTRLPCKNGNAWLMDPIVRFNFKGLEVPYGSSNIVILIYTTAHGWTHTFLNTINTRVTLMHRVFCDQIVPQSKQDCLKNAMAALQSRTEIQNLVICGYVSKCSARDAVRHLVISFFQVIFEIMGRWRKYIQLHNQHCSDWWSCTAKHFGISSDD